MNKFLILLVLFINNFVLYSQNVTISGSVIDSLSNESVVSANIIIVSDNYSVSSNGYGYFSISTKQKDSVEIIINHLNYRQKKIIIPCVRDTIIQIKLNVNDVEIESITVTGNNNNSNLSTNSISVRTLQILPSVGGENDLMKIFKLMPGVQSGENKSSLSVRGGSDDQNLIIIDDVPLYYVNHLGGFVSVFNTDALKDVSLVKGGFPARYGSRLSSVFDIKMKDGNLNDYNTNLSIGLISSKISVEGPIEKNKSSFIISVRRFNLDLIMRPLTSYLNSNISIGYNFHDLNFKLNRKFNDKNRLFFSLYSGDDKIKIQHIETEKIDNLVSKTKSIQDFKWGNLVFALRFNHVFNAKLFSNTTLSYTRYRNINLLQYEEFENYVSISNNQVDFFSGIKDYRLNVDFQYAACNFLKVRTGGDVIFHQFNPGTNHFLFSQNNLSIIDTSYNRQIKNSIENNYYIENQMKVNNFAANIGIRVNLFSIDKNYFYSIEPRINTSFSFSKSFSVNASLASMNQNVHKLTFLASGMPLTIWIPATLSEVPSSSLQYTFGVSKIVKEKIQLSAEVYYKKLNNLITLSNPSSLFSPNQNYMDFIAHDGVGRSYGFEFLLQKQTGKFQGWFSYTFSKTTRQFEQINSGYEYVYELDRPHSFSVVGAYNFNDKISVSANWVYGTGFPYSFVNQTYSLFNVYGDIYLSDQKNGKRMDDFHKLDVSLKFTKFKKNDRIRVWSIDVYNAYNRKNATYYQVKTSIENDVIVNKLYKVSLFPIIPSVSYSLKF